MMRIGSLFSGIGGLELGLEAALGGEVVWQVERETFPRQVLAHHWPNADRTCTDVTTAHQLWRLPNGRDVVSMPLARVDLICGGFPCQDISPAGGGGGIHGSKSGLWSEFARVVCNLRPRFVVVENSAALPSRGLGVVLGDLASLGYDAEWTRIGAVDVGAPHRRWRCFIIAWDANADQGRTPSDSEGARQWATGWHSPSRRAQLVIARDEGQIRAMANSNGQRHGEAAKRALRAGRASTIGRGPGVANSDLWGRQRERERGIQGQAPEKRHDAHRCHKGCRFGDDWLPEPAVGRVVDGVSLGVDGRKRLRALGNAVVPQVAYQVGLRVRELAATPTR